MRTAKLELVPIIQRLRPRQIKGVVVGVARGEAPVSTQTASAGGITHPKKRRRARVLVSTTKAVRRRVVRTRGVEGAVDVQAGEERDEGAGVGGDVEGGGERGRTGSEGEREEEEEKSCNGAEDIGQRGRESDADSSLPRIPKLRRTHATHAAHTQCHSIHSLHTTCHDADTTHAAIPADCDVAVHKAECPYPSPPDQDQDRADQDKADEYEYPQPSTNYQKMQRQLAREKQLEGMRAREAAYAREERFLRRQDLSRTPERSGDRRCVMWKDENSLVEVFAYSPCSSSRGSTLDPDDIPGS